MSESLKVLWFRSCLDNWWQFQGLQKHESCSSVNEGIVNTNLASLWLFDLTEKITG